MINSKEYKLPNGKKAVFEYDACGIGKITLECMDELMGMIADIPQGEWIGEADGYADGEFVYDIWYCSNCDYAIDDDEPPTWNFCPNCGARMKGADDETD